MSKLRIGVLASGGGSNLQSIINSCKSGYLDIDIALVISNNSKAYALERAKLENIPSFHISSKTEGNENNCDEKILSLMQEHNVDLIVLAGYMKLLGAKTLSAFENKILNIHPALLPKFGGKGMYGMNVHNAVITAQDSESGATVHLVNSEYDKGRILAQASVIIDTIDTPETLAQKVLMIEHKIYPETLSKIAKGEIKL